MLINHDLHYPRGASSGSPCSHLSHPIGEDRRGHKTPPFVSTALTNAFHCVVQSTLFPYFFLAGIAFSSQLKIKIAAEFIFIFGPAIPAPFLISSLHYRGAHLLALPLGKSRLNHSLVKNGFLVPEYQRAVSHEIKSTESDMRPCSSIPFLGKNSPNATSWVVLPLPPQLWGWESQ